MAKPKPKPKPKIVVVDDSPAMRSLARAGFARAGFTVFDTDSEDEAIRLVLDERPDVVLLDLFMPEFPTGEFIRRVQQIRVDFQMSMELLIYSGRSSHEIREIAARYEVDGYIQKMGGIRQCVDSVVERIRPRALDHG